MTAQQCQERQSVGVRESRAPRCQRLGWRKVRGRWLCWSHALLDERDCPPGAAPMLRAYVVNDLEDLDVGGRPDVDLALPSLGVGSERIVLRLGGLAPPSRHGSEQPWERRLGEWLRSLVSAEDVLEASLIVVSEPEALQCVFVGMEEAARSSGMEQSYTAGMFVRMLRNASARPPLYGEAR